MTRIRARRSLLAAFAVVWLMALAGCNAQPEFGHINGTVTEKLGSPAAKCAITVATISGGPVPELAAVTGSDGTFRWPVPPGTFEVSATCDTFQARATIAVRANETVNISLTQ